MQSPVPPATTVCTAAANQCTVKVFDTDGNSYDYTGKGQNESVDVVSDRDAGTTTIMVDGKAAGAYDHSVIVGPKYVPVAVPAADYEDFKKAYTVYENGTEVKGGYTEKNLSISTKKFR